MKCFAKFHLPSKLLVILFIANISQRINQRKSWLFLFAGISTPASYRGLKFYAKWFKCLLTSSELLTDLGFFSLSLWIFLSILLIILNELLLCVDWLHSKAYIFKSIIVIRIDNSVNCIMNSVAEEFDSFCVCMCINGE